MNTPLIRVEQVPRREFHPGWLALGVLSGGWLLQMAVKVKIGLTCPIKWATGFPCIACGSGRAARALLAGEVSRAVMWNPLFVFALLAMAGMAFGAVWQLMAGYRFRISAKSPVLQRWRIWLLAAAIANEVYLIASGI